MQFTAKAVQIFKNFKAKKRQRRQRKYKENVLQRLHGKDLKKAKTITDIGPGENREKTNQRLSGKFLQIWSVRPFCRLLQRLSKFSKTPKQRKGKEGKGNTKNMFCKDSMAKT